MFIKQWKILSIFLLILTGCSTTSTQQQLDPTNLNNLENLTQQNVKAETLNISKIRGQALREIAMGVSAQGGLAWRSNKINQFLKLNKKELSKIFNFNGLMLENHVLPPVMQESKRSLQLASPNVIRTSDRTYKIIKQAKFVTTAPTWQDYLFLHYKKPDLPDQTLLPRNKQEREIWIKYVNIGWEKGIEQANNIYADNLARLQIDFKGMMLYRKLLAQNIVSKPFVARSDMGITSNENKSEIRIDDSILRITAVPTINSDSRQWKPVIIQR